jgi:MFS family permease
VHEANRWLAWGLPALLFLIAFLHRPAPGVIAGELMQDFGATGATIGLLSATYYYGYAGLMVPAGVLVDLFGVRRVVAAGGAVMGLGTLAMSLASTQAVLFAGRLAIGLGGSVTFIGAVKVAATRFPASRFGTLSAVTASAGILGGVIGTAPLAGLVSVAGWRGAFLLIACLTVACAVGCYSVGRDHPEGLDGSEGGGPRFQAVRVGMRAVFANPHTWPPFLAFLFLSSASYNLMLWVVPCLRDLYGLSTTRAAVYATANPLASLVASPLTGFVSDRIVRRRKLPYAVLTLALSGLWGVLVVMLGALPLPGLYALLFATGLVGSAFVLSWPIGREVNPPHLAGIAVAVVNMGGFLGIALSQGPVGALLDARWAGAMAAGARVYPPGAYRAAFAASALLVLVAALLTLLLRETRCQNVYAELRQARRRSSPPPRRGGAEAG